MEALRDMNLPPGFGFHPSDAELISHYLKKKIHGQRIDYDIIPEVDIYKHEPWDLPSKCNLPIEDNKWHFFAYRDRKYPTGAKSNRTTRAGYWKSTGKDRAIKVNKRTLGTKKTLVFHEGRPPSGKRTEWIMHEYYIDENECQASPEMKDAFVLCRVTKREDWALENGNEVGNRNPHSNQLNDAVTSVAVAENQEDAAASGICAGEPNHVATPASAEQSDVVAAEFIAHSPKSESEVQIWLDGLFADPPSYPGVDNGFADVSLIEQNAELLKLQNPDSLAPKTEPDQASPSQNDIDIADYLTLEDLSMFAIGGFNDASPTNQAYSMIELDHGTLPNNFEGTWNGELQLHQGNCNANLSNENADNGITVRRRNVTVSSDSSSQTIRRLRLQTGIHRMVTSNSETINETIKYTGNSGRMRSFRQSEETESSENLSNQRGRKNAFRSSAGFNVLFACVCMIGVIAAVLKGYYHSGISL
ncbi:hypothetical protein EJB05_32192 [Eragrostis curvula]|uniref:NAC domain-containing protein n=1 Tax=Eragrostis curvula TaxID=38414 RepID=A0A5J9UFI8_9POAL|nr:hypothetical protein EJB05_32192 [Eragrostis curvula]